MIKDRLEQRQLRSQSWLISYANYEIHNTRYHVSQNAPGFMRAIRGVLVFRLSERKFNSIYFQLAAIFGYLSVYLCGRQICSTKLHRYGYGTPGTNPKESVI